jgi:hypothetical protein
MEVYGQLQAPAALIPGKINRYPLAWRLGELRVGLDAVEKRRILNCRESRSLIAKKKNSFRTHSYGHSNF